MCDISAFTGASSVFISQVRKRARRRVASLEDVDVGNLNRSLLSQRITSLGSLGAGFRHMLLTSSGDDVDASQPDTRWRGRGCSWGGLL